LHIDLSILKKKSKKEKSEDLFGDSNKNKEKKSHKDLIKEYFDEITTYKALTLNPIELGEAKGDEVDQNEAAAEKRRIQEEAEALSR